MQQQKSVKTRKQSNEQGDNYRNNFQKKITFAVTLIELFLHYNCS